MAGDDWRTTGMVVDSGTITHDGDSVDVLVTVSESSAASTGHPGAGAVRQCRLPYGYLDAEQVFHSTFDDLTATARAMYG